MYRQAIRKQASAKDLRFGRQVRVRWVSPIMGHTCLFMKGLLPCNPGFSIPLFFQGENTKEADSRVTVTLNG